MAKKKAKASRGSSRKPARKAAKKAAKKPAPKRAAKASKPKATKRGSGLEPVTVKSGRGPTPAEIGADLVAMFNRGQLGEIEEKWWSREIVSCEGNMNMEWRGVKAVHAKNAWWMQDHEIRGASAEGPFIGASGFAVKFKIDVATKSTGAVDSMEEVGVYTIRDGKIVREEFMGICPAEAAGEPATA